MKALKPQELARIIAKYSINDGETATAIPGVSLFKASSIEAPLPSVYEPCLCIIAQGAKEVALNDEFFRYEPNQYLVVGVDLPILNRIIKASKSEPYLLMKIRINLQQVSELIVSSSSNMRADEKSEKALFIGKMNERMHDCILRLARMLHTPQDIPILGDQTLREIYYYILRSENGASFAQIAVHGSNTHRIAKVIQKIKVDFKKSLRIDELAEIAGMSTSAFHRNFKLVTEMSPLQFQKKLKLIEARTLMSAAGLDAATTAYELGYESPSHFSRDYTRMYGNPPGKDIELLKARTG